MTGRWQLLPLALCVAIGLYAVSFWLPSPALITLLAWFVGAAVLHDLVLLPLYSAVDRGLVRLPVSLRNHVRVPAAGAALTFLLFLPGITGQGADTHLAATGLDTSPYLGNWLLLVAALFGVSALLYLVRALRRRRRGTLHA
jgi:hypothetical protein